jgi:hypothetical protein
MQIQDAYDVLSDPSTRTSYNKQASAIRNAWIQYDKDLFRWLQHDKRRQEEEQAETQAREKRRRNKAEYNKKWRAKKTREQAEEAVRVANEEARTRAEEQRAKHEQYKRYCEADIEREAAQRQAAEQIRAKQLAAQVRQKKEHDAELRTRLAAEHAQSQNQKVAEERLRQIRKKEAEVRMREIARLSREEAEKEERKRKDDEEEAIKQWQAVIEQACERDRVERVRLEQENAMHQKKIAEDWKRANLHRQQELNEDVKPNIDELRNDYDQSTEDTDQRENAAAENFIQEIMKIRGERKSEVLKDVVLITLEAIDREIAAQKQDRKRKASSLQDDSARLPALVTEIFAKMEANGDTTQRFRFSKKRKVT